MSQFSNFCSLFCFQSLEICILFQWITLQFINQKDVPNLELMTNDYLILSEVFNVIWCKHLNHFSFSYTSDKNNFPCLGFNFFSFPPAPLFSTLTKYRSLKEKERNKCKILLLLVILGKGMYSITHFLYVTFKKKIHRRNYEAPN